MLTRTNRPAAAAGGLAAALGLLVMAGWHGHRMDLVRVLPSLVPTQYDAAVCFFLCGAGLAALAFGRRRPAAALGTVVALLASWSLLRVALGVDLGLERLFSDATVRDAVPASLRTEPLSALAFILAGTAFLGAISSRKTAVPATLLAGAVLAAFGSIVFLCYLGGIASAFGWDYMTRVPPQSGLGFAVVGAGFLLQAWPRDEGDVRDRRWLAFAAGTGAATAALFLCLALKAEERQRIQWHVDAAASEIASEVRARGGTGVRSAGLRPEELFGSILRARTPSTYSFAVYLGRRPVYVSPGAPERRPEEYARDVEVRIGDEAGWVHVWPSAEILRVERSRLPASVGAMGLLLALLLAWSISVAQLARRQGRELEATSSAKSRFLANISREFGNPLNSIIGFSEILLGGQEGTLNAEQEQDLRAVRDGGRRLALMMRELQLLARLEAGKTGVVLAPTKGGELLEQLRDDYAAAAAKKGLSLRVEHDADADTVLADRGLLRQALAYLVDNAVKYTRRGEIVLGLHRDGAEAAFSVRDTGVGFFPEEKDRLFELFWQSPRLDGIKKTEGLGLGLYLAKRLVESQGGSLLAGSATAQGATFSVRLPSAHPPISGESR